MATTNNTIDRPDYFDFAQDLIADIQDVEAILWGASAIHDRIKDDSDMNHIYMSELMLQMRDQMAKLRSKVDGSSFRYEVAPTQEAILPRETIHSDQLPIPNA